MKIKKVFMMVLLLGALFFALSKVSPAEAADDDIYNASVGGDGTEIGIFHITAGTKVTVYMDSDNADIYSIYTCIYPVSETDKGNDYITTDSIDHGSRYLEAGDYTFLGYSNIGGNSDVTVEIFFGDIDNGYFEFTNIAPIEDSTDAYMDEPEDTEDTEDDSEYEENEDEYPNTDGSFIAPDGRHIDEDGFDEDGKEYFPPEQIYFDTYDLNATKVKYDGKTIPCIIYGTTDKFILNEVFAEGSDSCVEYDKITYTINGDSVSLKKSDDEFTAVKSGTSYVTATYYGYTATICIKVADIEYKLSKAAYTIKWNQYQELKFTRADNKTITWPLKGKSSNSKVAVYDTESNTIHAKKAGTCTITFTMSNSQKITVAVTVPELTLIEKLLTKQAITVDTVTIYSAVDRNDNTYKYAILGIGNKISDKKTISYLTFNLYQYDNKGTRIYNVDTLFEYNDTLYDSVLLQFILDDRTRKFHSCIKTVNYDDGTTWTNPLYKTWNTKYSKKY